jgi:7-cyano-7-deazaguanine reductase
MWTSTTRHCCSPLPAPANGAEIGIAERVPFFGADMWTAFELSWLNPRGKPQVALAHFTIACESTNIIESKSLKLYLNSFNNTPFADVEAVKTRLRADLTEAVWRNATPGASMSSIGVTGAGA